MDIEPDIERAIPGSLLEIPCGCRMWDQGLLGINSFTVFKACRPNCFMFRSAMRYAHEFSVPVTYLREKV